MTPHHSTQEEALKQDEAKVQTVVEGQSYYTLLYGSRKGQGTVERSIPTIV